MIEQVKQHLTAVLATDHLALKVFDMIKDVLQGILSCGELRF